MLERTGLIEGDAAAEELVVAYHGRKKTTSIASVGYMDWVTQPDPFRLHAVADFVRLPLPKAGRPTVRIL